MHATVFTEDLGPSALRLAVAAACKTWVHPTDAGSLRKTGHPNEKHAATVGSDGTSRLQGGSQHAQEHHVPAQPRWITFGHGCKLMTLRVRVSDHGHVVGVHRCLLKSGGTMVEAGDSSKIGWMGRRSSALAAL